MLNSHDFKNFILVSKLKSFQHSIVLGLLLLSCWANAQTSINSTNFIQEQLYLSSNVFITNSPTSSDFKAFWLEEIEFRTETRDFDFDRQSYTLRFTPSNKKVRAAQNNLAQHYLDKAAIDRKNYNFKFVEQAYEDWIELYSYAERLKIFKNLLAIYTDIEKVLLQLGKKEELKVKDLLEVKSDITTTKITIQTLESAQQELLAKQQADFSDLISIQQIKDNLLATPEKGTAHLLSTQQKNIEASAIETEMALEVADQKRFLDFFQIEYRGPHSDEIRERFSIGAGLKIPFKGSNQLKLEELKVEQALLQEEYKLDLAQFKAEVAQEQKQLKALISEYHISKDLIQLQQKQAEELIIKLVAREGSTPLVQLYHQIEQGKQALNLVKLKTDIYEQYIRYLVVTEALFATPFQNYLVN